MNYDEILTFLSVVEHSNISKAANELYISQGTASTRLMQLESRLQVKLFYRQKGIKGIILTPEGERFLPIARQWMSLLRESEHIKDMYFYQELRITATDMLNQFVLLDAYRDFMENQPDVVLRIQTEHSTEIHQLIENQQVDLGFAFNLHIFPSVQSKPLYEEEMVFLCHKDSVFAKTRNISDLKAENEIAIRWSSAYQLWHDNYFKGTSKCKITLGTVSMIRNFIGDCSSWTIVTSSIAALLINQIPDLCSLPIDNAPPRRTAYVLSHRTPRPWVKELTDLFLCNLIDSLKKNPALTILSPF